MFDDGLNVVGREKNVDVLKMVRGWTNADRATPPAFRSRQHAHAIFEATPKKDPGCTDELMRYIREAALDVTPHLVTGARLRLGGIELGK